MDVAFFGLKKSGPPNDGLEFGVGEDSGGVWSDIGILYFFNNNFVFLSRGQRNTARPHFFLQHQLIFFYQLG